jgi:hypothetical protein
MMSHTETEHALAIHSRREATLSIEKMQGAKKLREDAEIETKKWSGSNVGAHQQAIRQRAELAAQQMERESARHLERSAAAGSGYLLHGPEEQRDVAYCIKHQALVASAGAHGLLRSEPMGG